ncbi:Mur ligase domain-containing protein [Peptoniphilus sp. GNH]|nr:Mur ligase domain-containing protein [Peptoniphilus sp. GNH]
MKLKELLRGIEVLEVNEQVDFEKDYNNLAYHSQKVKNGGIFIALKGSLVDGHKYLYDAVKKGANLAFVEEIQDLNVAQIRVENTRKTMADLANNFYENPSSKLHITGITATNGKTSTAFMLKSIYEAAKYEIGISGTVELSYKDVLIPSLLTTPESLDLQMHFANMVKLGVEKVVMEVSSSGLESYRVRDVDFDIVTFNNFSREHIDQHGSLEKYYKAKSSLIRNAKEKTIAILNMDFKEIKDLTDKTKAVVVPYSLNDKSYNFHLEDLDISTGFGNYTFVINDDFKVKDQIIKKGSFKVKLKVAGYSAVMNSFVAILVAMCQGIELETIIDGIESYRGVERRFEMIYNEKFKVIDDHFANSRNIEVTLDTIRKMSYKKLHLLYGIRGNRGTTLNRENGRKIVDELKGIKLGSFITTKSVEMVGPKDKVSDDEVKVLKEVLDASNISYEEFDRLDEALDRVLDKVEEDDLILLGGCQGLDKAFGVLANKLIERNLVKDKENILKRVSQRIC